MKGKGTRAAAEGCERASSYLAAGGVLVTVRSAV